jgi:hypothetical protein
MRIEKIRGKSGVSKKTTNINLMFDRGDSRWICAVSISAFTEKDEEHRAEASGADTCYYQSLG